ALKGPDTGQQEPLLPPSSPSDNPAKGCRQHTETITPQRAVIAGVAQPDVRPAAGALQAKASDYP
ncbi:hypothetical protein LJC59_10285, partial [Desulfovibrio sp. OttesenSCG-928-A18]|nr:hypothetical protein [Desulfovibrio sp. OttesenSCG-928-A18]